MIFLLMIYNGKNKIEIYNIIIIYSIYSNNKMNIEIINANGDCINIPYENVTSIKEIKKKIEQKHGKTYNSLCICSDEKQLRDYNQIKKSLKLYCIIYDYIKIQLDANVFNLSVNITFEELYSFIKNKINKTKATNDSITFIITCNNIKLNKSNYIYYLRDNTGNIVKQSLNSYYIYWNNYNVIKNNKYSNFCKYNFNELNFNLLIFDTNLKIYNNEIAISEFAIQNIDIYYLHDLAKKKYDISGNIVQKYIPSINILSNSDSNIITYCMFSLDNQKIKPDLSDNNYPIPIYYFINLKTNMHLYNKIKLFEYYILVYIFNNVNNLNLAFHILEKYKESNIINTKDETKLSIKLDLLDNLEFSQNIKNLNDKEYTVFIYPNISILTYRNKKDMKIDVKWIISDIEFH